jgi:hypothetical protein
VAERTEYGLGFRGQAQTHLGIVLDLLPLSHSSWRTASGSGASLACVSNHRLAMDVFLLATILLDFPNDAATEGEKGSDERPAARPSARACGIVGEDYRRAV